MQSNEGTFVHCILQCTNDQCTNLYNVQMYIFVHYIKCIYINASLLYIFVHLQCTNDAMRGCSRRGTFVHALFCPTALVTFVSKYVFGLFLRMTQHVIYSQVYVIINGSVCGWGGGGGNCCQRGGISYAMGEGGWPHPQGYA